MEKPVLIILAAGMGSRYGGLKQMDPIDEFGNFIMDYSLYDAHLAGFETAIFVIKPEMEELFESKVGKRAKQAFDVKYAFQRLDDLPKGFSIPEGRTKPWGTAHATLSARHLVKGPFCVINSDDYYGRSAYQKLFQFLSAEHDPSTHAMVGFRIENTLTENGYVSRGVCQIDENGYLREIIERVHIEKESDGAFFIENEQRVHIPAGTMVSLNTWGFQHSLMEEIESRFPAFLDKNLPLNPLKCEYFLPAIPDKLIHEGIGSVKVLESEERWYGVTYQEDKEKVVSALKSKRTSGMYPESLWG